MKIYKYSPEQLQQMNHEELTKAYYQEKAVDTQTFNTLHSKLLTSKARPQTQPTLEQRIQMLEERIDELETINTL